MIDHLARNELMEVGLTGEYCSHCVLTMLVNKRAPVLGRECGEYLSVVIKVNLCDDQAQH